MVKDLAAELVTKHQFLIGFRKIVVADAPHQLAKVIAVIADMQIRATDAAAQDLEDALALG